MPKTPRWSLFLPWIYSIVLLIKVLHFHLLLKITLGLLDFLGNSSHAQLLGVNILLDQVQACLNALTEAGVISLHLLQNILKLLFLVIQVFNTAFLYFVSHLLDLTKHNSFKPCIVLLAKLTKFLIIRGGGWHGWKAHGLF